MRLPDQAFACIRQHLNLPDAPVADEATRPSEGGEAPATSPVVVTTADRPSRREPRWPVDAVVPCARYATVGAELRDVRLKDLSAVGVCVIAMQNLMTNDRFVIYLPWGEGRHVALLCTTQTCRIAADGTFRIGANFTDPGDAALRRRGRARSASAMLAEGGAELWTRVAAEPDAAGGAAAASTEPNRRAARTPARGSATIYTYHDGDRRGPLEQVEVRDVSAGGVGVLRGDPMEVGDRFVVHLEIPGGRGPTTRLARVVNVSLADNRYRLGAEFIPFPRDPNAPSAGLAGRVRKWLGA